MATDADVVVFVVVVVVVVYVVMFDWILHMEDLTARMGPAMRRVVPFQIPVQVDRVLVRALDPVTPIWRQASNELSACRVKPSRASFQEARREKH